MKDKLMSLDPSINNLGIAIWDMSKKQLLDWQLVHPAAKYRSNEYEKSYSMLMQLKVWKAKYEVDHVICEVPAHWAVGGFEARETGSIAKLSFVCGLIYSLKCEVKEMKVVIPSGWKGQISKDVMANRLQSEYWDKYEIDLNGTVTGKKLDPNVADAIGIGHYYLFGRV